MLRYILVRLAQGAFSTFGVMVIVFVLTRMTGSPLDLILPLEASPEMREQVARELGLDQSVFQQFVVYVRNLASLDFGTSIRHQVPVWDLFIGQFPNTLALVVPAFVFSVAVGIPMGVVAATAKSATLRRSLTFIGLVGMAVPAFWLGIMLIFLFNVQLRWLPSAQMGGPSHYVLPTLTLSAFMVAGLMRLIRSQMLDVLGNEYIKLARLKGLPEYKVIWKHALRNSLSAAATFLSVFFGAMLMGSVVVETVFAWPGMGRLLYNGITNRDYPVVQGLVLVSSVIIILVSLAADIIQAFIDPRIRQ